MQRHFTLQQLKEMIDTYHHNKPRIFLSCLSDSPEVSRLNTLYWRLYFKGNQADGYEWYDSGGWDNQGGTWRDYNCYKEVVETLSDISTDIGLGEKVILNRYNNNGFTLNTQWVMGQELIMYSHRHPSLIGVVRNAVESAKSQPDEARPTANTTCSIL